MALMVALALFPSLGYSVTDSGDDDLLLIYLAAVLAAQNQNLPESGPTPPAPKKAPMIRLKVLGTEPPAGYPTVDYSKYPRCVGGSLSTPCNWTW